MILGFVDCESIEMTIFELTRHLESISMAFAPTLKGEAVKIFQHQAKLLD